MSRAGTIWRVCKVGKNVDMLARTRLTERGLVAHAKQINDGFVLIAIGQSCSTHIA